MTRPHPSPVPPLHLELPDPGGPAPLPDIGEPTPLPDPGVPMPLPDPGSPRTDPDAPPPVPQVEPARSAVAGHVA